MYIVLNFYGSGRPRNFLYEIDFTNPFYGYITTVYRYGNLVKFLINNNEDKRFVYLLSAFPSFKEFYLLEEQKNFKLIVTIATIDN